MQASSRLQYKDVVEYILNNRGQYAFTQMDTCLLLRNIKQHVNNGTIQIITRENPYRIVGVVVYSICLNKCLYVGNIVITEKGVLKEFISLFKQLYPDYTIVAERYGKPMYYDFNRKQLVY